MKITKKLIKTKIKLAIVGLGYVGMPLLLEFSKKIKTIGYDINTYKIEEYRKKYNNINFTSNVEDLKDCNCFIIAVPTPIKDDKTPDLSYILDSTKSISKILNKNSIVIYESTVYPTVTETICKDIIERESKLKFNIDFFLGYSPERINPGDKKHKLKNITKIVSGSTKSSTELISKLYSLVIDNVCVVSNIKTAEAIKLIENTQRDLNIALMNEFSFICKKENIDIYEVIKGASTKWNFYKCYPGLVGGHCIGIDPYYYIYLAEQLKLNSDIVKTARKINENMTNLIVLKTNELLEEIKGIRKILILGITYKKDTTDTRNSKIIEIAIKLILNRQNDVIVVDSVEVEEKNKNLFNFAKLDEVKNVDLIILGVSHQQFEELHIENIKEKFKDKSRIIEIGDSFKDKIKGKIDYYWNL